MIEIEGSPTKCHTDEPRYGGDDRPLTFSARKPDSGPYFDPCTCDYCGSIHPAYALELLEAGAAIELADMKYGWPAKFYLDAPNPKAGQQCLMGTTSRPISQEAKLTEEDKARFVWTYDGDRIRGEQWGPAPARMHPKFYATHMVDADDETFDKLVVEIQRRTGVCYARDEQGRLMYAMGKK